MALCDASNVGIAYATVTHTTFTFSFTPVILLGNTYYYFAVFGTSAGMYAETLAGVAVVDHIHRNTMQGVSTGASIASFLIQPSFTMIGY